MLFYPDIETNEPSTHALIIGVGGYPHIADGESPNSDVTDRFGNLKQLTSAPRSAARLAEWVVEHADDWVAPLGSLDLLISPVANDNFVLPNNHDDSTVKLPTFDVVENAYLEWKKRCDRNQDNIALFYFCGHGGQKGATLYLLCQDFGASEANIWRGSFDFTRSRDAFHACNAERQFFFVDACRKLTLGLLLHPPSAVQLLQARKETDLDCPFNFTQFAAPKNESAVGPIRGISDYAQALMKALDGGSAKKVAGQWVVTTGRLVDSLEEIARMLDLPYDYDPRFGRETNESAVIIRVPTPKVQVTLSCEPEEANESVRLSCQRHGMADNDWPYVNVGGPWTLELPSEIHAAKAEFEQSFKQNTPQLFAPRPPTEIVPIPLEHI